MQDKLSDYGYGFQTKVISSLISNKNFISDAFDILKIEYFTSEPIKFLATVILDYFKEYHKAPTLEVFKVKIEENGIEGTEKEEIKKALKSVWSNFESTDLEYIQQETIKFCKNQEMKAALLMSVDLLKKGNYDRIRKIMEEATQVGVSSDIGLDLKDNFDRRYEENVRDCIETPWEAFNDLMKGGLAPGELGLCIAPSGAGKSWVLANIGAHAQKIGKRVVHYTLELNEDYVGLRYDCIISGIPTERLKEYKSKVKEKILATPGETIVKEYPTKSISVIGIEAHLNRMRALGKEPDLVIIDYADLMSLRAYSSKDKHEKLQDLYEDLRGLAGRFGVPIWTVSQSNREGLNDHVVDADKTSGSYGKIFTADFVFSLSRRISDKETKTGRILLIKNRFGPDGIRFPATVDLDRGIIQLHHENSSVGQELDSEMKTGEEANRMLLRQRANLFLNNPENSKGTDLF